VSQGTFREKSIAGGLVYRCFASSSAAPVTSIITTGSVKWMNLKKGGAVFAIIKATEVPVEPR
jgi:molybdopterin-binding protein